MGRRIDTALAILNGALGDHLARTGNGLATEMAFVHRGRPLTLTTEALASALPNAGPRVVVLVHGLMCNESVWELPGGGDYGAFLARDLGYTPLYVRYNSGRSIVENGAALAQLLGALDAAYPGPLEEILLLGYSMGGLVLRSACHCGWREGQPWLGRVRRAVYVGTPHLGTPLERLGRGVAAVLGAIDDPYARLAADLANLRSAGVRDLGDPAHPVPLLRSIRHHQLAGTLSPHPLLALLLGDAVVSVRSAMNGIRVGGRDVVVVPGLGHLELARRLQVYGHIRSFCAEEAP